MKRRGKGWATSGMWLMGVVLSGATSSFAMTRCVNPSGAAGCLRSIQAAVDAASAGDLISVGPGTYYENVLVPTGKDGLRIVGAGKLATILDPDNNTDQGVFHTGDGLTLNSANVQVRNLTVRNGQRFGILVEAAGAVLQGLNVTGPDAGGIVVDTPGLNAQILQNEVHATPNGIYSVAAGCLVRNNVVTNGGGDGGFGIYVAASGAQVVGNRIANTYSGLVILGDLAVVRLNDVRHQFQDGISVDGAAPIVERNRLFATGNPGIIGPEGYSLNVVCTNCAGASVAYNTITDGSNLGLVATGESSGMTVKNNTLLRANLALIGTGITARANRASEAGSYYLDDPCFWVIGDDHTASHNTVSGCAGAGFLVNGNGNSLDGNLALGTSWNGFMVDGNNAAGAAMADAVLTGNATSLDAGQGFAIVNGAVHTTLSGNTASRNRTDLCDEGNGTSAGPDNRFGTRSSVCAITH